MSDVRIFPSRISGSVTPPSSKSHAHRLMIVSAVSGHPLTISGNLNGDDIAATAYCLSQIGTGVERGDGYIRIIPGPFCDGDADAGESGSTLRMLLPVIPTLGITARFTGRGRLPDRPIADLTAIMRNAGAEVSGDRLPLTAGGKYSSDIFRIVDPKSSQHVSGFMIASARSGGGRIEISGKLPSKGYVEMTKEVLSEYGVRITEDADGFTVENGFTEFPETVRAEGDWSGAAAFAAAAAVAASGGLALEGLKYPSAQPDSVIVKLLSDAGAKVSVENNGAERCSVKIASAPLKSVVFDADGSPDIVPVLAAVTAFADGESSVYGVERLKIKESDRVNSVVDALNAVGVPARYDGCRIAVKGGRVRGGTIDARGDHRIAMMGAVLGLGAESPVTISGAECVKKSYSGFFEQLASTGGKIEWLK